MSAEPEVVPIEEATSYTITQVQTRRYREPPSLRAPKDVYKLMRKRLRGLDREHFYSLMLNVKNVVVAIDLISVGSLNASIVHPREILKPAILASAASIILVHNHPTGDPTPSREDIEVTRRMAKCGDLIGIELMDHVVIGNRRYQSLKESGYF